MKIPKHLFKPLILRNTSKSIRSKNHHFGFITIIGGECIPNLKEGTCLKYLKYESK